MYKDIHPEEFSLFSSILFSVHVSAKYKSMDKTSTLYSSIFVEQLISLADKILLSDWTTASAFPMQCWTSSEHAPDCDIFPPR